MTDTEPRENDSVLTTETKDKDDRRLRSKGAMANLCLPG